MQTYSSTGLSLLGARVGHQENEGTPATGKGDSNSLLQTDVAHRFSDGVKTYGPSGQDELPG